MKDKSQFARAHFVSRASTRTHAPLFFSSAPNNEKTHTHNEINTDWNLKFWRQQQKNPLHKIDEREKERERFSHAICITIEWKMLKMEIGNNDVVEYPWAALHWQTRALTEFNTVPIFVCSQNESSMNSNASASAKRIRMNEKHDGKRTRHSF